MSNERRTTSSRPRRMILQWHVTERCNLRCAHCYQSGERVAELDYGDLLEIPKQFRALLARRNAESGAEPVRGHVTVTGGEPFVRRDFVDLLEELSSSRNECSFAVLTNGSFIDSRLALRLAELGPSFVQVSVEGSRATHDTIRGKGDFDRTVAVIRRLVAAGVRTFISFTAHRQNYRDFPAVAKLGGKLGVARVWSDRLVPDGAGAQLKMETLTPDETFEYFALMRRARGRARRSWFRKTEVTMHRALQFLVGDGVPYHCTAGDMLITVLPNGDVVPCRRLPITVGNVMETPLEQLYYESPMLRSLRDDGRVSRGCETCACRSLCRGGLRCLSHAVTGDPFRADPGCWIADSQESEPGMIPLPVISMGRLSRSRSSRGSVIRPSRSRG